LRTHAKNLLFAANALICGAVRSSSSQLGLTLTVSGAGWNKAAMADDRPQMSQSAAYLTLKERASKPKMRFRKTYPGGGQLADTRFKWCTGMTPRRFRSGQLEAT
jgi:hypothetical protein